MVFSKLPNANVGEILSVLGGGSNALADGSKQSKARRLCFLNLPFRGNIVLRHVGSEPLSLSAAECRA